MGVSIFRVTFISNEQWKLRNIMRSKTIEGLNNVRDFIHELCEDETVVVDFSETSEPDTYEVRWVNRKKYISFKNEELDDEVWCTVDGKLIVCQDLEAEHARNIVRMMIKSSREMMNMSFEDVVQQLNDIVEDAGIEIPQKSTTRVLH